MDFGSKFHVALMKLNFNLMDNGTPEKRGDVYPATSCAVVILNGVPSKIGDAADADKFKFIDIIIFLYCL